MSEKKYKNQVFKALFDLGFSVSKARKKAYDLRNLSRDLKKFENKNSLNQLKDSMIDSCSKFGIIAK